MYKIVYLTNLIRIHIVKHKETLLMMFSLRYRLGLPPLALETETILWRSILVNMRPVCKHETWFSCHSYYIRESFGYSHMHGYSDNLCFSRAVGTILQVVRPGLEKITASVCEGGRCKPLSRYRGEHCAPFCFSFIYCPITTKLGMIVLWQKISQEQ